MTVTPPTGRRDGDDAARAWSASIEALLRDLVQTGDPEAALAVTARLARYVEHLAADLVADARAQHPPLSWARIGRALGISRQAANERFSEAGQAGAVARRYRRSRRTTALRAAAARPEDHVSAVP